MSRPPDVTVLVVNYNGREITPACLESIPPGVETVVVDNGSKDGSPDDLAARLPSITLIRNKVNRGFAAAVNQAMGAARGRYFCLLNSDARLSPEALRTLVAYLDAHPEAGMAAPQLLHEDGRRQHSFDNFPSLATVFLNKSLLRLLMPARFPSKKQEIAEPREVESVIGACMMVRRALVERIGGLDEAYFLFLEETDWCLGSWGAGAPVVVVPGAKVVHLQGRTRDTVRVRARIEYTRSLFTFFRKNRPATSPLLRALYPLKSLVELVFQTLALWHPRVRSRWVETVALAAWQAAGCPRSWGLSGGAEPKYVSLADGTRISEDHLEPFNDFERKRSSAKTVKDRRRKRVLAYTHGERSYLVRVYKVDWPRRILAAIHGSREARELAVSIELQRRGVPAVPVAAMRARGDDHWVAYEKVAGWEQLQETLLSGATAPALRRRLCFLYGRFARRLLDAGVWQYDFNPTNVLVNGMEFRLIDLERMTLRRGRVPEEGRFYLLGKMNRVPALSRTDRLRFLRGYCDASAADRRRWKELARTILGHGRLQDSLDAERAHSRCTRENRDYGAFAFESVRGHYLKERPERPGTGLSKEELQALVDGKFADGLYEEEYSEQPISAWKGAVGQLRRGGRVAVAVLVRKDLPEGRIVFRRAVFSGTKPPDPV